MTNFLIVIGASVRAAAASALRAGLQPWAIDMFADVDLRRLCPATLVTDFPAQLTEAAAAAPACPWIYTGALENHPSQIRYLASQRELYGNQGPVLARARDPRFLADALAAEGLAFPRSMATAESLPRDGSWLRKRRRSAGGLHLHPWDHDTSAPPNDSHWFFQRRVSGIPCSGVYVAAAGRAQFLGATEQCLDRSAAHPFRYAGSLGPLPLAPSIRHQFEQIGRVLAERCGLVGLFGVDAILDDQRVWTIEVNPRYTASVEILERALGIPALAWHVQACRDGRLPATVNAPSSSRWFGKRVLYAPDDVIVPEPLIARLLAENARSAWPRTADLPAPGSRVQGGDPVLTVFAEAADRTALLAALATRLQQLSTALAPAT